MRTLGLLLAAGLCLIAAMGHAALPEGERILLFDADIRVGPDGRLTVTETLTVDCRGEQIQRGIFRELPLREASPLGGARRVDYALSDVRRDGRPEPFHTERSLEALKVYVGDKNVFLDHGVHTFVLTYVTSPQVRFLDAVDEVYWNVTGNGWGFPIEQAQARVRLPGRTPPLQSAAYTGPRGARGKAYAESSPASGEVHFATTAPLAAGEGLTVAVGWAKGVVPEPTPQQRLLALLAEDPGLGWALGCLVLSLGYLLAAWVRVGRDPTAGTIVPLYAPPEGLDAPAVRYLSRMDYDDKALAAGVVELAVAGRLLMGQTDEAYELERTGHGREAPSPAEQALEKALFADGSALRVSRVNRGRLLEAGKVLRESLEKRFKGAAFNANLRWNLPGSLLFLASLGLVLYTGRERAGLGFMLFWLAGWSLGCSVLLWQVSVRWKEAIGASRKSATAWLGALFLTAFALPFLAGELLGLFFLGLQAGFLTVGVLAAHAAMLALFGHLLKAPTVAGRKLLDGIAGFRLFLTVAEAERLNLLNPPERTPQLFEAFLPYAMALDVEQAWGEQFAAVLAAAAAPGQTYHPIWYSGSHWSADSPGAFVQDLGASFSQALASASTSSSSGGSGGGGSSGGGGGGGGGGGW